MVADDAYSYDTNDQRSFLTDVADDVKSAYKTDHSEAVETLGNPDPDRVVVCGMGGSAIAPDLLSVYLDDVDIETNRYYEFQSDLTRDDLVIISSYSGNTEEVINCYRKARRSPADVAIISTGGRLADGLDETRVPLIELPKGYIPRAALPYAFFTFLNFFESLDLTPRHHRDVNKLIRYLRSHDLESHGEELSAKLEGNLPVIYTTDPYYPVAYRWETQLNENAKTLAKSRAYSEANHNEICGYRNYPGTAHVVMISYDDDHSRIRKRYDITKDVIKDEGVGVTEIRMKGTTLTKLFGAVLLGDWTSYYLALRYEEDPSETKEIDDLKDQMGKFI